MSKKLVAYFSASGVTGNVAKLLAEAAEADLFEIKPEVPYTSADLDWQDMNSRSSVEMRDKSFRPAIAEDNAKVEEYDVIFVGFPIWLAYHNLIQCTQAWVCYTVDFLSKKREANEGEVPQYYVEGSHDAIIEPAEWQLVQMEIQRRKNLGRRFKESSGQASGSFRIFWPFFLCEE